VTAGHDSGPGGRSAGITRRPVRLFGDYASASS
jgi:hypothetical protein